MGDRWAGTVSVFRPRAGGLYALPGGREFLLVEGEGDCYLLLSPGAEAGAEAEYLLSRDGRIYRGGTRTNWGAEHLTDTGRTVERPAEKAAAAAART